MKSYRNILIIVININLNLFILLKIIKIYFYFKIDNIDRVYTEIGETTNSTLEAYLPNLTLEVYFRNVSLYMLVYGSESLYMTDKMFIGDVLVYLANFGFISVPRESGFDSRITRFLFRNINNNNYRGTIKCRTYFCN
jgi:hypothetical protein